MVVEAGGGPRPFTEGWAEERQVVRVPRGSRVGVEGVRRFPGGGSRGRVVGWEGEGQELWGHLLPVAM